MSLATGRETKAHCQACGIATTASPNADSRRAVWASTMAVPDGTDQAGNIGPQAAEAAEESAKGVSCVGNIGPQLGNIGPQAGNVVPQAGNIVPQTAEAVEEDTEGASGVGNIVPRKVEETEKKTESATCVSSVGNIVPRGVKETSTRAEVLLSTSRVDNQVPHSESETPPARPVEEQCHVFDGVSVEGAAHLEALSEVSALLNLEELSMKDFLVELKAGEIAEMVLLKPETSPEDLNSSSVMNEDVLEGFTKQRATRFGHRLTKGGFTKQRATRLGSEILKNPEDPVYPLVEGYSDVVSKHPPSQLPPDRGVRHEIGLVSGTKYCVTRQWPLPREQCKVIDAFFAEKAKSGMVRESKAPHLTPTFCVRRPNGKWRLVHAYNKLNNATPGRGWPDGYGGASDHLRRVFEVMRANKLYANIDQCVFAAEEIKDLGCFSQRTRRSREGQGHSGLADPEVTEGPPEVKDDEGRERVISLQSRQLKAAERNYPVYDKVLLAMNSSLGHEALCDLYGSRVLVDCHQLAASVAADGEVAVILRGIHFTSALNTSRLNVLADALSRRPDYELAHVSRVTTDLYDRIRLAYQKDENYTPLAQFLSDGKNAKVDKLSPRQRAQPHRYELADGLLHYRVDSGDPPRVVVPNDEDL
ncbi:LOW QUALITY PROTEIN: Pol protein, partial [Phytophthora palmivora]